MLSFSFEVWVYLPNVAMSLLSTSLVSISMHDCCTVYFALSRIDMVCILFTCDYDLHIIYI